MKIFCKLSSHRESYLHYHLCNLPLKLPGAFLVAPTFAVRSSANQSSLGSFPSPQSICPLLFVIALLSPQTLPLVYRSTGFLSIHVCLCFLLSCLGPKYSLGKTFLWEKGRIYSCPVVFPSRRGQKNSSYFGVPTLHSAPHQGLSVHDLI